MYLARIVDRKCIVGTSSFWLEFGSFGCCRRRSTEISMSKICRRKQKLITRLRVLFLENYCALYRTAMTLTLRGLPCVTAGNPLLADGGLFGRRVPAGTWAGADGRENLGSEFQIQNDDEIASV